MRKKIEVGTVVRDKKWDGTHTGTVVKRTGRWVFVAWHGSCVEDQLDINEVEVWNDAPPEFARWRGGIREVSTGEVIAIEADLDHARESG